jgi:hypothetical protein
MSAPDTEAVPELASYLDRPRRRGRNAAVVLAVVVLLAGGGAAAWITWPWHRAAAPQPATSGEPTGLQAVVRETLSEQTSVDGTIGYAGSYAVVVPSDSSPGGSPSSGGSAGSGTYTTLPAVGQVVRQGQPVCSVGGSPVTLLYGAEPVYRTLSEGLSGTDVQQLNADLVALGDATASQLDPTSDYFSAATATALDNFQGHLGLTQTGTLPLGQAVFEPTAIRVSGVSATLGALVQPGAPVLQATSTTRQVVAQVDPNQLSDARVGAHVTVTLPDNSTTPGVVTSIATEANASPGSGPGTPGSSPSPSSASSATTVNVDVRLIHPDSSGTIDLAPVQVTITTATARNVLAIPVDALVAEASGDAVEVAGPGGSRRIVPVTLGLFDDAASLVQVTGPGLAAGQQVVVPKI